MALTRSKARAKDNMTSRLCETEPKVKKKCIECYVLMCDKCFQKNHPKSKSAQNHQIIEGPPQGHKSIKHEDNQKPSSIPGNFSMDTFGSFQTRNRKITMTIKKAFTTEITFCHDLAVCDKGKLWICQQMPTSILQKVSVMENALQVLETPIHTSTKIMFDMKTFSNDLFIAYGAPTLELLKRDENILSESKFAAPDKLYIVGFDFSHDGKVVMATRSTGDQFPVKGRRAVVRMTCHGKQEMVCEYDQHKKRIFSCPKNICCTKIGNFLVLDRLSSDYTGRVICMSYEGNVINTFHGLPETTEYEMSPSCIISTPSDSVLVCDFDNDILYWLDNNGEFLSSFDTTSIGIIAPYGMVFTNPNTLYIGCTGEDDNNEKAKLYEIDFSETYKEHFCE